MGSTSGSERLSLIRSGLALQQPRCAIRGLVRSHQSYGIALVGPVLADNSWQAKAGKGFDVAHFQLDWQAQQATCPQGQVSHRWTLPRGRLEGVLGRETVPAMPMR